MNGNVQLELWLHEYKACALEAALGEHGITLQEEMQARLADLYADMVPQDVRREIDRRIDAEFAAAQAEWEAARKYTAFRVRENGEDAFFELRQRESFLDVAKFLRRYLRDGQGPAAAALQNTFASLGIITAEQYDRLTALHMENPGKVTGVFDLDFDRREVSTVDAADGWKTYSMKDVSAAVYQAYRKSSLLPEQYEPRFRSVLAGKEIISAGHLSARDISLAEEICEMDGQQLNFYLEAVFDVDTVFGTQVRTAENDDTLNVYADYDMATGQACDALEVDLHWADGREETVEYRLNAAEKTVLLRKMDAYCQQQTGRTLVEYSAQRLAEDMTPPTQPVM